MVTLATVVLVFSVTWLPETVAMTTSSVIAGTAPPLQVVVAVQRPPLAALVTVPAIELKLKSARMVKQIQAHKAALDAIGVERLGFVFIIRTGFMGFLP